MKFSISKIIITTLIGVAVVVLGFNLLVSQSTPIKPFDYLSFLTGLSGFIFSLFQVVQESKSKETHRKILKSLFESATDNISRVQLFSLKQENAKNISELLVGVLQQERVHIAGLLNAYHDTDTVTPAVGSKMLLPSIDLIEGHEQVRSTLKQLTENSHDFLYIVGGRSRDKEYLEFLTERVKKCDLDYLRVVTGDHIREPLYWHLDVLSKEMEINENLQYQTCYLKEDKYGSFSVTRDAVFMALPSSTETQLTSGVLIHSSKVASDFRAHVIALCRGEEEPKSLEFYKSICKEFWSKADK